MALGKKKKKTSKKKKTDKEWRNIGTIWESDHFDGQYVGVNKEANLFYQDPETEEFFRVKQMSLFDPSDKAPEAAVMNLAIDLKNEYQVEQVDDEE